MKLITKKLSGCNQSTHHNNLSPLLSGDGEQTEKLVNGVSFLLCFLSKNRLCNFHIYLQTNAVKGPFESFKLQLNLHEFCL